MTRRRKALLITSGLAAVALGLWAATYVPPLWWRPPNANDPAAMNLAQQVESGLVEQAHRIRDDDSPWSIRIRQTEVNAWLATRLPRWIAHEQRLNWPEDLLAVQARFTPDRLTIGIHRREGPARRVAAIGVVASVVNGRLTLTPEGLALGLLPIPGTIARSMIANKLEIAAAKPDEGNPLKSLLSGLAGGGSIDPVLKLSDGRSVELVQVTAGEGELILTCRTLPRGTGRAQEKQD